MRAVVCSLVVAGALLLGAGGVTATDPGQVLLDAELTALDGTVLSPRDLTPNVLVVNFWATWCRPCQRELTALDAWRSEFADRGVEFLAISVDTDRRKVDRFLRKHDIGLTVVHDGPEGLARRLDLPHLPCTYVLDATGRVVAVAKAGDPASLDQLRQTLLALIPSSDREVSR